MKTCNLCEQSGVTCKDRNFGFSLEIFGVPLIAVNASVGRVAIVATEGMRQEIHLTNEPIAECDAVVGSKTTEGTAKLLVEAASTWGVLSALSHPGNW